MGHTCGPKFSIHRRIRLRAAIEGLFLGATVGWHGYRTGTAAHDSQGADRRINLGHDWGITTGRASFGRRSDEVSNEYWCVVRRPTEASLMWPKVLMLQCAASQGPVPGRVGAAGLQQGHRSGVGPRRSVRDRRGFDTSKRVFCCSTAGPAVRARMLLQRIDTAASFPIRYGDQEAVHHPPDGVEQLCSDVFAGQNGSMVRPRKGATCLLGSVSVIM